MSTQPPPAVPFPPTGHTATRAKLGLLGLALLVVWGAWWAYSFHKGNLAGGRFTWIPAFYGLGIDFQSTYYASRLWVAGGNPYRRPTLIPDLGAQRAMGRILGGARRRITDMLPDRDGA